MRWRGRALVLKVDTDRHPELASRYDVRGIPNFIVLKHGQVVMQHAGVVGQPNGTLAGPGASDGVTRGPRPRADAAPIELLGRPEQLARRGSAVRDQIAPAHDLDRVLAPPTNGMKSSTVSTAPPNMPLRRIARVKVAAATTAPRIGTARTNSGDPARPILNGLVPQAHGAW